MNRNEKEMYKLFNETRVLTNEFKKFKYNLLIDVPYSLIIFRYILGLSQKKFSKLIKLSSTHLCDIENEKERLSKKSAKRIIKQVKYIINNKNIISFDGVYNNYKSFIGLNKLTSKRAKEIRKLRKIYAQKIKIEDVIERWKGILNSPRLAKIIGQINGDGHLQLDRDRALTSFNSNNFYEIKNINKEFKELFGVNGIIYKNYKGSNKHKIFFSGKGVALFLMWNGVIKGNKTNQIYNIPKWIINGNKETKGAYLKGFYDTEGSIYPTKEKNEKIRWRINLIQAKNEKLKDNGIEFMEQVKLLLKNFKIESSPIIIRKGNIRKDGSKSIFLTFNIEKKGFENFYKHIGFDNKKKQQRLITALNIRACGETATQLAANICSTQSSPGSNPGMRSF